MGSRSSNNLLHETETLWGRTHVASSPKKNLSCTTAFQQPHLDARFDKDSQTLNAENNAKWFIRKSGADWSQLHSERCSRLSPVEKCKRSPGPPRPKALLLRAERAAQPAKLAGDTSERTATRKGAEERGVQMACRRTNERRTRKKRRIATHPHNQLEEEGWRIHLTQFTSKSLGLPGPSAPARRA